MNRDELNKQFRDAAARGDIEMLKLLLDRGADIHSRNCDEWTALHNSARRGHVECLKYLVEHGAHAKAITINGSTAIHLASEIGHLNCIEYLVSLGVSVDAKTSVDNKTALHIASENDRLKCVKYLIEQGASLDALDKWGRTPFMVAIINEKTDAADLIGAIMNARAENKTLEAQIEPDENADQGFGF